MTPLKHVHWFLYLTVLFSFSAQAHVGTARPLLAPIGPPEDLGPFVRAHTSYAGVSRAQMRIGLEIAEAEPAEPPPLPDPAKLDYPASPNAVLCRNDDLGYRECHTPFRGPVRLAREIGQARCVKDATWGWREGVVWVDRGCGAVFQRIDN